MNERIEELAQGCFEYFGGTDIVEFNYKKFAELIVGECNSKLDNIGVIDRDSRTIAMKVISEHFGVEE
jgi:hypothetical protein